MSTNANTVQTTEKSANRNFYAIKETPTGKSFGYAFESSVERDNWIDRHNNSKKARAIDVYRLIKTSSNEALAANRNHRVFKVKLDDEFDAEKGHRIIRHR